MILRKTPSECIQKGFAKIMAERTRAREVSNPFSLRVRINPVGVCNGVIWRIRTKLTPVFLFPSSESKMQAKGIKTALACILFGILSLGPGGHFQADEGVSLRRDAGGHFAAEFPPSIKSVQRHSSQVRSLSPTTILHISGMRGRTSACFTTTGENPRQHKSM